MLVDPSAAADPSVAADRAAMAAWLSDTPDTESVAQFRPGPGIARLSLRVDLDGLRAALADALAETGFEGDWSAHGFGAIALTRRPGQETMSANDLSGRYWLRADDRYEEEAREDLVDEAAFSELVPRFRGGAFEALHQALTARFPVGRMRILSKAVYNCNSWHRDPEPRLHIPLVTNPGSLFVVNHHVTHLPADGSVYFTDTRGYHTALNGGEDRRIHIVAALPI